MGAEEFLRRVGERRVSQLMDICAQTPPGKVLLPGMLVDVPNAAFKEPWVALPAADLLALLKEVGIVHEHEVAATSTEQRESPE